VDKFKEIHGFFSPMECLGAIIDQIQDMESIVIIGMTKDGRPDIAMSSLTLMELAFLEKALATFVAEKFQNAT